MGPGERATENCDPEESFQAGKRTGVVGTDRLKSYPFRHSRGAYPDFSACQRLASGKVIVKRNDLPEGPGVIIACRDCKKSISSQAPACPHCGCPRRRSAWRHLGRAFIYLAIALATLAATTVHDGLHRAWLKVHDQVHRGLNIPDDAHHRDGGGAEASPLPHPAEYPPELGSGETREEERWLRDPSWPRPD